MIRNKSYIFSGDMQVITEILDGKTFHQCASRIDEFYCLKFGDTCITRKNTRFISYVNLRSIISYKPRIETESFPFNIKHIFFSKLCRS